MNPEEIIAVAEVVSVATPQISILAQQIIGMLGGGLVMGLGAVGSGIGLGIVGSAAVGAWKRCYKGNRPAPPVLLVMCGMPMSQTFYGFILMLSMLAVTVTPENAGALLGFGIATGLALCFSAIAQGKIAAAACDALADNSKGLGLYIMALGIAESIALFAMVFTMINL